MGVDLTVIMPVITVKYGVDFRLHISPYTPGRCQTAYALTDTGAELTYVIQEKTLPRPDPCPARALSAKEFLDLTDILPEIEWFADITNPQTRRAYQNDLKDLMRFA